MAVPVLWDFIAHASNAVEFTRIVTAKVIHSLAANSILVVDGAKFHVGWAFSLLAPLLALNGHQLVVLPAYSPELSPVEMVFSWVKYKLKERDWDGGGIVQSVLQVLGTLRHHQVMRYYLHCGYRFIGPCRERDK
jgi:hypothetical protein